MRSLKGVLLGLVASFSMGAALFYQPKTVEVKEIVKYVEVPVTQRSTVYVPREPLIIESLAEQSPLELRINEEDCISTGSMDEEARRIGEIYDVSGFESAKEAYLALVNGIRGWPRVCGLGLVEKDKLEAMAAKDLPVFAFWRLTRNESFDDEYPEQTVSQPGDLINYLNAQDLETRASNISEICDAQEHVFTDAGVVDFRSNRNVLCRYLLNRFPTAFFEGVSWIHDVPEVVLGYEYHKHMDDLFYERRELPEERTIEEERFVDELVGLVCAGADSWKQLRSA